LIVTGALLVLIALVVWGSLVVPGR